MKKFGRMTIASLLILLFLVTSCIPAFAAGTLTVDLDVQFGQTEARSMLAMINDFRTGNECWYWNSDDTTKTWVNAAELEYDYALEQIAMQRAVEIAITFSHSRPDGTSCFTASIDGYTSSGENIAAGYGTAAAAFVGWQETDDPYAGQGHRRNMLSEGFTHVGIGHVYVNGFHYWVQEFARRPSGAAKTAANDSKTTAKAEVKESDVTSCTVDAPEILDLTVGGSIKVPTVGASITLNETWPGTPITTTVMPDWTLNGSSVSMENGLLIGKSFGSSTLTAKVFGKKVSVEVYVGCSSHTWGSWTTVKAPTCTADGYKTRQCSVCEKVEKAVLEAKGHNIVFGTEPKKPGDKCTIKCTEGDYTESFETGTGITFWWNTDNGNGWYYSNYPREVETGFVLYLWMQDETNVEHNEKVFEYSVDGAMKYTLESDNWNGETGYFTFIKPGTHTLTVSYKYNPTVSYSFTFTVTGDETSTPPDDDPIIEDKPVPTSGKGDVNGNGSIDMTDYIILKRAYFGTYQLTEKQKEVGDMNDNGTIDMTDYILLKRVYFGTYTV